MTDFISRQDAIDALTEANLKRHMDSLIDGGQENRSAIRIIMGLPSAERKGKWKISNLPKNRKLKYCSECGWGINMHDERHYNYCPNCGADMRGEEE